MEDRLRAIYVLEPSAIRKTHTTFLTRHRGCEIGWGRMGVARSPDGIAWGPTREWALQNIEFHTAHRQRRIDCARSHRSPRPLSAKWVLRVTATFWGPIGRHPAREPFDHEAVLAARSAWFERTEAHA